MSLRSLARGLWARLWLRRSQFSGGYGRLRALYTVQDPWNLTSAREQERFAKTNVLIRGLAPDCRRLLELGCGEGYQTERLLDVSPHVTGVEVSGQAVARARVRCPGARFLVGRAEDAAGLVGDECFDLVTAFEVLYYAKDIPSILADMQRLAPRILVTNYSERARLMASHFKGPGWRRLDDLTAQDTVWHVHQWTAEG